MRWACHVLEGHRRAKAALLADAVRVASKAPSRIAARIPEVRDRGLVGEMAGLRGRTRDVAVVARTAIPAILIPPIGVTTEGDCSAAAWLPIMRGLCLSVECTAWGIRLGRALWAHDAREGRVAAIPALSMDTICPATQPSCLTVLVPIVRDERLVHEVATTRRASDAREVARTAKSALEVLAVCVAAQPSSLSSGARWIPKVAHADWRVLERTSPRFRGGLGVCGQGLAGQCDDGDVDTIHVLGEVGQGRTDARATGT